MQPEAEIPYTLGLTDSLRLHTETEADRSSMDSPPTIGRILCVTSNFPRWPGDSTTPFVLNLAQDLQALGWQVDVLAPHAPHAKRQETINGVHIERFRYLWPEQQQTVCYQGGALINLRKNPFNKLKLPALVAAETLAIVRKLHSGKYDLMHSHWILPQGFTGMLARRTQSIPHVLTVHGGDIFGLKGKLMTGFKRAALHDADAVTVNSSITEAAVQATAESIRRLERIPMGVSVQPLDDQQKALAVKLRGQYRIDSGPLLLFIGRLVEEKGVEDLLHATRLLSQMAQNTRTLIVGEGQDRAAMQRLAETLGIADITTFTGWVDSADIPAYLHAADVFVGPSRTAANGWVEAQGLTFLEAMAAGTPVVATQTGGIVDSVIDGETGLLVEERAPAQLAAALQRMATDSALRQRLSAAGKQRVGDGFSRQASAERFSDLFAAHCKKR